jgi:hypothetical protein
MAEPTINLQANEGTEATPSWVNIDTAVRWTGNAGVGDAFPAPISGASWFDDATAPDDGEFWHDTTTDAKLEEAGRNTNQNVIRALESGASDGTADPPEFTAYDDATDAGNRTAPTIWILIGTTTSGDVSIIRGVETTGGAPGSDWQNQPYASTPSEGNCLEGDVDKVTCSSVLAASGNKLFNVAAHCPDDPDSGNLYQTFVYCLQYTYT